MSEKEHQDIRLNRFIAMCGICSRRKADELIQNGAITINSTKVLDFNYKVSSKDIVIFKGDRIKIEKKRYVLLNKPQGYITTMHDERGRKTVIDLVADACKERLVPVGRLDKDTTGLLLFTNDGLLAKVLMHPKYNVQKIYHVVLNKKLKKHDFLRIKTGLFLTDGLIKVDDINYMGSNLKKIKLNLHVGKNRVVRRIFKHLGYDVLELDRVVYGPLFKASLSIGQWRYLTKKELELLKQLN